MIFATLGTLILITLIYLFLKIHRYWSDRNVIQGPILSILREYYEIFTQDVLSRFTGLHNKYPNKRYFGLYVFGNPALFLRDPELIKEITVKHFENFPNHSSIFSEHEELWSKNLFALKNEKWREMRSIISPIFSSSKIKQMFILMDEIAQQFCDFFIKQNQPLITVEMRDTFTRFTNDVIASTAFGIKCNSLTDPENEFYRMGAKLTTLDTWRSILWALIFMAPNIFNFFKITFFPQDLMNFFKKIIASNVEERERKKIVRPDLIHLLMEANKGNLKYEEEDGESEHAKKPKTEFKFTITDMTAQALIFFFAGFESVSSLLCFTAYELALNSDIQERLRNEVDEVFTLCSGKLTYEAVNKMKYLDMVISETLRKWPPNGAMDRNCVKPFTIEPKYPDESPVIIEKGINIWYAILGLHHDPKYFPNPDKYDPERFNDENRPKIKPFTYLPFGSGPRHCIGSRFALIEAKIIFVHILKHFEIVKVEKTEVPLKIGRMSFSITAENGFWLGLKRRTTS